MSCLTTIASLLIWLVVVLAAIAILRLLIATIFGMPLWPAPPTIMVAGQPQPAVAGGMGARIAGLLLGVLDILFWAVVAIALIWLVIDLFGCLGSFAGFPAPPWRTR